MVMLIIVKTCVYRIDAFHADIDGTINRGAGTFEYACQLERFVCVDDEAVITATVCDDDLVARILS